MTEAVESASPPAVKRRRWHAFIPLALGILASAILLTWDAYRRTTIQFRVSIDLGTLRGISATIDGQQFLWGNWVKPGHRKLVINAADAEPLEREISVGLGVQNLGEFQMHRSRGGLAVDVTPEPLEVRIIGEFSSKTAKGTPATFDALPVGRYQVAAVFEYSRDDRQVDVVRDRTAQVEMKAAVGAVALSTEPADADFDLAGWFGREIRLKGKTPAVLPQLPAGQYVLQVMRGEYRKELRVDVKPGETNELKVAFEYAELSVATDPPGATIFLNAKEAGQTPKTITELRPGQYGLRFEREGFLPIKTTVMVKGNESISVVTNLMSEAYLAAMESAKRFGKAAPPQYDRAVGSLEEALKIKPGDVEASGLKERFTRSAATAAGERQAAEVAARRQAVLDTFKKATDGEPDADMFDIYTWSFETPVNTLKDSLLRSLQREPVVWLLKSETKLDGESYLITCMGKGPLGKYRHASIQLTQFSPQEVIVHAKFWDYLPRQGQELAFLIRGRESLLPAHPRYGADEKGKEEIIARRKALAEDFKARWEKEVN